jgi:hypothetical protein
MIIVSDFRTSVGSKLFMSTDSSTREYYPDGTPRGFIFTVAEVEELVMLTNDSSKPGF